MMNKHLLSLIKATQYSISGLRCLIKERAFFQEIALFPAVLVILYVFDLSMKSYLVFSYVLILITEALNTCIECTVDRISTEPHELSKKAKDIGSAAVFIAILHFSIMFLLAIFGIL
ncbi:MAG: diacylglycerol kinase [Holosporales bacterium]|jgi:diacylglycerol kinase (ATP)|nr:diacylglycerol kinase [Holosporales bacterium]